ncbi:MAG: DAK2 domain-containing protein [Anaerosomatales bacterium]|nr:DAK2 domain-containing protein [Anaerosomatales bacterium]MDT8433427.1 DAK2 domain-containing protein [Anaerosomatales bacterium]
MTPSPSFTALVGAAANALRERAEEVNRLNVFPVPDGDTGTNMSLTMDAVVAELGQMPPTASVSDICQAVTHGSLMGARGNSGVILSQILRGLCEVIAAGSADGPELLAGALERATAVAFQAVRKPVEGTMLTVLRDSAAAARSAADAGTDLESALDAILAASVESVRRTPELLPVLKENGVVDAGGFGLSILAEGLLAAWRGTEFDTSVMEPATVPVFDIQPVDDWDDEEYVYCTEFLLLGEALDRHSVEEYVASQGGSELVVGEGGLLKIHVHTDDPGAVLSYMTALGEVAEVHINNMRQQTEARTEGLRSEPGAAPDTPRKAIGFVAVGAGDGIREILASLGVDMVVNGGQTMNPSTAELLAAAEEVHAESVIILPNNKNIQMAAQQVIPVAPMPVAVVPTTSVPEAFAAMLAADAHADLDSVARAMTQAAAEVRTGEVTTAVKDSKGKVGPISKGQVIGIADHEIEVVGEGVADVALKLADIIIGDGETLTLLGGSEVSDTDLEQLAADISAAHPEIEVEHHRGGQPLYPVIMSVE